MMRLKVMQAKKKHKIKIQLKITFNFMSNIKKRAKLQDHIIED